jgi:hypothetical protein
VIGFAVNRAQPYLCLTSDGFLNGPNKASLAYRLFSLISDDSVDCRPNRRIRHPCLVTHRRCILVLTRRRRQAIAMSGTQDRMSECVSRRKECQWQGFYPMYALLQDVSLDLSDEEETNPIPQLVEPCR